MGRVVGVGLVDGGPLASLYCDGMKGTKNLFGTNFNSTLCLRRVKLKVILQLIMLMIGSVTFR